jgi:hypothetical protein
MKSKWMLIFPVVVFLGCRLDLAYDRDGVSIGRVGDGGYFYVDVSPDVAKQLGKPDSEEAKNFVDKKIRERGLCKDGHVILSKGIGRGNFYFKGKCL